MAQHKIILATPDQEVGNADLQFKVKRDGKAIGTLKVSKGNVEWVPKDHTYGYKLSWPDFAETMILNGRRSNGK